MAEPRARIAAVVLAAGSSQRMGSANKLHLPIGGEPLLRRSLRTLLDSGIDSIVVVLGYEHEATRKLIQDFPVHTVYNEAHEQGQMTSVHRGLEALGEEYDGIFIALGDQPALRSVDIDLLIDAFLQRDGGEVVVPTHEGERGNPIIISNRCRRDILAGTRNLGCRRFIDKNPELVRKIEMTNPAVVIDLDTPEEYARFAASLSFGENEQLKQKVS